MTSPTLYQKDLLQGHLTIRYPTIEDTEIMQDYFNALSAEKTYIRSRGEQVSFEEEKAFLENVLTHIKAKKAVRLLAFLDGKLIGIANIDLSYRTERHIGELGISVAKEQRGHGLGAILINVLIEESTKELPDLELITLCVFEPNQVARMLYKNLGFIEYGTLPNGVKLEKGYFNTIFMYKQVKK